ncbi:MAG: DUF1304 domain-containing protein [Actinomycetota bacterium]|nr:DUF1304 domain-containing protein [Actinomycetota bacterium]
MNAVAQVLAIVEAVLLIGVGSLEAFGSHTPLFQRMFGVRPEKSPAMRLLLVNQGFYNIVFALGFLVGALLPLEPVAARTLLVVLGAGQAALGVVLFATAPKLWRGALVQTLLALAVAVTALL